VLRLFKGVECVTGGQKKALENAEVVQAVVAFWKGIRDVLLVAPCGSGKTLAVLALAAVQAKTVVLVLPYKALANSIEARLEEACIPHGRWPQAVHVGAQPLPRVLLLSADKLRHAADDLQQLASESRLLGVVVDEAHVPLTAAYRGDLLQNLQGLALVRTKLLFMSGTFPPEHEGRLREEVHSPALAVVRCPTVRPNVAYTVDLRASTAAAAATLVDDVNRHLAAGGRRALVFVLTQGETAEIAGRFEAGRAVVHHSGGSLTDEEREAAVSSFQAGATPVMVATSGFGTGTDDREVDLVAHFRGSHGLLDFGQESSRGGRAGQPSRSVVYTTQGQIGRMQPALASYLASDTCRRAVLQTRLDGLSSPPCVLIPGAARCDNCTRAADAAQILQLPPLPPVPAAQPAQPAPQPDQDAPAAPAADALPDLAPSDDQDGPDAHGAQVSQVGQVGHIAPAAPDAQDAPAAHDGPHADAAPDPRGGRPAPAGHPAHVDLAAPARPSAPAAQDASLPRQQLTASNRHHLYPVQPRSPPTTPGQQAAAAAAASVRPAQQGQPPGPAALPPPPPAQQAAAGRGAPAVRPVLLPQRGPATLPRPPPAQQATAAASVRPVPQGHPPGPAALPPPPPAQQAAAGRGAPAVRPVLVPQPGPAALPRPPPAQQVAAGHGAPALLAHLRHAPPPLALEQPVGVKKRGRSDDDDLDPDTDVAPLHVERAKRARVEDIPAALITQDLAKWAMKPRCPFHPPISRPKCPLADCATHKTYCWGCGGARCKQGACGFKTDKFLKYPQHENRCICCGIPQRIGQQLTHTQSQFGSAKECPFKGILLTEVEGAISGLPP